MEIKNPQEIVNDIYVSLGICSDKTGKNHSKTTTTMSSVTEMADKIYKYRHQIARDKKSEDVIKEIKDSTIKVLSSSSILSRLWNCFKNVFIGRGFQTDTEYVSFVIKELEYTQKRLDKKHL